MVCIFLTIGLCVFVCVCVYVCVCISLGVCVYLFTLKLSFAAWLSWLEPGSRPQWPWDLGGSALILSASSSQEVCGKTEHTPI